MKLKNDTLSFISLDLETLDTSANAAIVSIGAVLIGSRDVSHHRVRAEGTPDFYQVCNVPAQELKGAMISPDTVAWWGKQPQDVQSVLKESMGDPYIAALDNGNTANDFIKWVGQLPGAPVWVVQGADFDIPIISTFLQREGEKLPGYYRHKVCLRTLSLLATMKYVESAVAHNALEDAKAQAARFASLNPGIKGRIIDRLFRAAGY